MQPASRPIGIAVLRQKELRANGSLYRVNMCKPSNGANPLCEGPSSRAEITPLENARMLKVRFLGKILPEPVKMTVHVPALNWTWQEQKLELTFRIRIENSNVTVECELEQYEPIYFTELYKRASDLTSASANLAAFATGYGVVVILETFIDAAGTQSQIVLFDPSLSPLCTAYGLEDARQGDFSAVFNMVLTEPSLFRALNDLIAAITFPHCSTVNCGRVIDSIRRMISPNLDGAAAWRAMHHALNVSRRYQEWISKQSTGPRHADPAFVPGTVTTEITRRTWVIMDRFLEYRKRGNQSLTAPDFPECA